MREVKYDEYETVVLSLEHTTAAWLDATFKGRNFMYVFKLQLSVFKV